MKFHLRTHSNAGLILLAVLLFVSMACRAAQEPAKPAWGDADREKWLADFRQLLDEMSSHYANLEWAVNDRRMDLPSLRLETEKKIRSASDQEQERKIFQKFLDTFGDGHLSIRWAVNSAAPQVPPAPNTSPCEQLGYVTRGKEGISFSSLPGFQPLEDPDARLFPGGILGLNGIRTAGLIRIALFSEHNYPQVCEEALKQLPLSDAERASCKPDSKCERNLQLATGNLLLRALERRIASLQRAGAQRLIVDITNNGGGSDWVNPLVRTLSPVPLRDMRLGFLKHAHWTKNLEETLKDVQADLQRPAEHKEVLREAAKTLQNSLTLTKEPCDRSLAWATGKFSCSLLIRDQLYFSGILPYAKPDDFAGLQSRQILFHSLEYDYRESVNTLPLLVLVNANTWSAAEYFAAILQDNKAAKILGQLTGGAGCGYTNGGIPVILKNSGARLEMPDCVRLRADGSNEVEGITPDVLVPWANRDSPYQQARKLELILQGLK
jgi:peptidase S41-like protein